MIEGLRRLIRDIPDFPKPGILFRDITPLLADPPGLALAVELLANPFRGKNIDLVVGAESRGFIFGTAVACCLSAGFVIVGKPGKALVAAGAAAGMAGTFGSPGAATLVAIGLLLFEFRARSFVPVALAATTAAGLRPLFNLPYPVFSIPDIHRMPEISLLVYIIIGAVIGVVSVYVTWAVYAVVDLFDLLPVHWMWWPAIGAV